MPSFFASAMVCSPQALKVGSVALCITPSFVSPGNISFSIAMRLADISSPKAEKPVSDAAGPGEALEQFGIALHRRQRDRHHGNFGLRAPRRAPRPAPAQQHVHRPRDELVDQRIARA